jgi:hypothetical protein
MELNDDKKGLASCDQGLQFCHPAQTSQRGSAVQQGSTQHPGLFKVGMNIQTCYDEMRFHAIGGHVQSCLRHGRGTHARVEWH